MHRVKKPTATLSSMSLSLAASIVMATLAIPLASMAAGADPKAASGNWPHWRGPTGNGVSLDADPPLKWSPEDGIAWKTAIPGRGSASPVVWESRVFVATAVKLEGSAELVPHRFVLLALDRATGKVLWERVAIEATPREGHHSDHGFASASPFTDGERVYAYFGSRGLFAFTLAGEPAWHRTDFGTMTTRGTFGEGSSPTLHGDSIIVPWDHEGPSYITAIDRHTGKTLWKTDRDETSSWGTPLVAEHSGKLQVITTGEKFARGYDFASGRELWRCTGQTGRPVASPVAGHGVAIIGSGFRGAFLGAFRLDGKGDLKGTENVAWSLSKHTPDIPSPLLSGTRVYFFAGRNGILSCHDVSSGKPYYTALRVEGLGNVYASPVAASGRVYLTARDGTTVTIEDGDELKILAKSSVGEPVDATPALAGKDVFIRGEKHLFAIRR